ncbi:unnamed protein product, partial [Linum tenue]
TGNPIDDCWRCDPNWAQNRQRLADCGIGFGRGALGGRGPGQPDPWNPPVRRDPGRAPLDRLRLRHDDQAQARIDVQQLQDRRRQGSQRPHHRQRLPDAPVREPRHHTQHSDLQLQAVGQHQRRGVPDPRRIQGEIRRRRDLAVRRAERLDRPLHAVVVHRRPDRRNHGVDGDHDLEQLLLPPQRGDADGPRRQVRAGYRDAGHHRVQSVRRGAGAADAPVPARVHTRRQQRFHLLADVCNRR